MHQLSALQFAHCHPIWHQKTTLGLACNRTCPVDTPRTTSSFPSTFGLRCLLDRSRVEILSFDVGANGCDHLADRNSAGDVEAQEAQSIEAIYQSSSGGTLLDSRIVEASKCKQKGLPMFVHGLPREEVTTSSNVKPSCH